MRWHLEGIGRVPDARTGARALLLDAGTRCVPEVARAMDAVLGG